ncbi:hypothetical protein WA158_004180 [Blastocystis sp. Blastoise]
MLSRLSNTGLLFKQVLCKSEINCRSLLGCTSCFYLHTQSNVSRTFLIPKSYRAKSFSVVVDPKDEKKVVPKHFVSNDLKVEKYIATDEKTHKTYIEMESNIAAMQQEIHRLYKEKQYDEALKLSEDCLVLIGDHFGDNHPVYACGLNDVALMCKSTGDYERASNLYEKAIKIYDYSCGRNHGSTLKTMMNLAILYKTVGDMSEGMDKLQCYMKAEELKKEIDERKTI